MLHEQVFQFLRASHLNDVPAYTSVTPPVTCAAHTHQYVLHGIMLPDTIRIQGSVITSWYFTSSKHHTIQRKHTAHLNVGYLIEYIRKNCSHQQATITHNNSNNNNSTTVQPMSATSPSHVNHQYTTHTQSGHHHVTSQSAASQSHHRIIATWSPDQSTLHTTGRSSSGVPVMEYCTVDNVASMLSESIRTSSPVSGWLHLHTSPVQQSAQLTYIHAHLQYHASRPSVDMHIYNTAVNMTSGVMHFSRLPSAGGAGAGAGAGQTAAGSLSGSMSSALSRVDRHTRNIYDHMDTLLRAQPVNKLVVSAMSILYNISDASDKLVVVGATEFILTLPTSGMASQPASAPLRSALSVSSTVDDSAAVNTYSVADRQPCANCSHMITTAQQERSIKMIDLLYTKVAMRYKHLQTGGELFYTLARQHSAHTNNVTEEQFKSEFSTPVFCDMKLRICARCDKELSLAVDRNGTTWKQIDQLRMKYLNLQPFDPEQQVDASAPSQGNNGITVQPKSKTLDFSAMSSFTMNDPHLRNSVVHDKNYAVLQNLQQNTALTSWQARYEQMRQRQHARIAREARRQAAQNGMLLCLQHTIVTCC